MLNLSVVMAIDVKTRNPAVSGGLVTGLEKYLSENNLSLDELGGSLL